MLAGQVVEGGGFMAVMSAVAELLFGLESVVVELTVAVLPTTAPLATEQFTVAISVMVADEFDASVGNVTVQLLPEPPQTPPPVEEQETNVVEAGRLSVTVIDDAAAGPLLVTVIVYVTSGPVETELPDAVFVIARSAS
jgi:hypothetical protein